MTKVLCAAIKFHFKARPDFSYWEEDLIVLGRRHFDPIMHRVLANLDEYYWSCRDTEKEVQGFIDTDGNFLTREEAYIMAVENNQIIREVGNPNSKELFSEHLY